MIADSATTEPARDGTMSRKRPTVADLRAMKGKRQLTMLRVMTLEEAEAAEKAGRRHRLDPAGAAAQSAVPRRCAEPVLDAGRQFLRDRHGRRFRALGVPALQGERRRGLLQRRLSDRQADGRRQHPGHRPCRADPVARHLDRRLQGGRQDRRQRHADLRGGEEATRRSARSAPRSRWCRSRSRRRFRSARR